MPGKQLARAYGGKHPKTLPEIECTKSSLHIVTIKGTGQAWLEGKKKKKPTNIAWNLGHGGGSISAWRKIQIMFNSKQMTAKLQEPL